ncbi:MAG: Rpn family recombination-promoting nuclease/putative transposase, partial [Clostridiales bacterium]|nr:Rpn family recombination-promoting nuclease/putative transposase [Clostridiales bacterium]
MARKIAKKKRGGRPFSNGSGGPGPVITKARDNGFKIIFGDHNMFADFLRDFIKIDLFKGVQANDIEDITERFLPLFQEGRDSDTIKTVRLKGGSTYVMVVLEHESRVNYRQAFKMLQYITLFYDHYEKEENKKSTGASFRKDFKYPAVLPVVFYDGGGNWTAETNFYNKVENNVVFARYTPSFEYLVVNLADYDEKALTKFGDALSIALIIAKMRWPDFKGLSEKLPEEYWNKVDLPP